MKRTEGEKRNIPVEVTVWDFAIPEEHSFDAPYGYRDYAPVASYEAGYDFLLRYRPNGGTFIIHGLYAMKDIEDTANK